VPPVDCAAIVEWTINDPLSPEPDAVLVASVQDVVATKPSIGEYLQYNNASGLPAALDGLEGLCIVGSRFDDEFGPDFAVYVPAIHFAGAPQMEGPLVLPDLSATAFGQAMTAVGLTQDEGSNREWDIWVGLGSDGLTRSVLSMDTTRFSLKDDQFESPAGFVEAFPYVLSLG
jgi:hypothetical protein